MVRQIASTQWDQDSFDGFEVGEAGEGFNKANLRATLDKESSTVANLHLVAL